METKKIYSGNRAKGYTTVNNGIKEKTFYEEVARRNGIIKNDIPTWAKCCGWDKKRN